MMKMYSNLLVFVVIFILYDYYIVQVIRSRSNAGLRSKDKQSCYSTKKPFDQSFYIISNINLTLTFVIRPLYLLVLIGSADAMHI